MAYTTLAGLIVRFGTDRLVQLTDREVPPSDAIDTDVVDRAIADADALIDGYLAAGSYVLPVASVPPLLTDFSLKLAFYNLHIEAAPEKVAEDVKQVMRQLEAIATGKIKLPLPTGAVAAAGGTAEVVGPERIFSRDTLRGL